MNVTVSIGRKIGSGPRQLNEDAWDDFKAEVLDLFDEYGLDVYFAGAGLGQYQGESEEAYTVIGGDTSRVRGWYTTGARDFRDSFGRLALAYLQDSIAVTFGEPEFVGASE